MLGEDVELAAVGVRVVERHAGELDHRALQAQAQAQVRDLLLARPADGAHLALHAAVAEAAGHQHAGHALELVGDLLRLHALQLLGADPAHLDVDAVVQRRVLQRLGDADVGIGQLGVLADDGDLQLRPRRADARHQLLPVGQVGLARPGCPARG